ncbi:MAG: VpsF family polysaccharide biosynthesis protein [Geminicoccaceae bacterium]|nr:VpsF family polysaccharide biosynthesis protein [Geminicoccaceae bacterium]
MHAATVRDEPWDGRRHEAKAGRISLSPDRRLQSGLTLALTWLGVLVMFVVPPPLLTEMGIPYDAPTGGFVFKLHPSTYLLLLAFLIALVERGNPVRAFGRSLGHQPAVAFYLFVEVLLIAYSVLRYGFSGAAFFIDSQLVPGILALLLARFDLDTLVRLFRFILVVLVVNAILGVGEQLLQERLIPLTVAGGVVLHEDVFRATALMGHPLANAAVMGFALFAFYAVRPPLLRAFLCLLGVVALLSFGGRTGFAVNVALLLLLVGVDLIGTLRRGESSYRLLTGGTVLALLLLGVVLVAVAFGGVGQRIIEKLTWDESASVRQVSFTVYRFLTPEQLLFGVSPDEILKLIARLGIGSEAATIENFWIVLSLQLGALFCALFAAGFLVFIVHLDRIGPVALRFGLFGFVLVASTSNSLSSKTAIFGMVVAIAHGTAAYRLRAAEADEPEPRRFPYPPTRQRTRSAPYPGPQPRDR